MRYLKHTIQATFGIAIFVLVGISLSVSSYAATYSMNPTSRTFEIGCERVVTIEIDATGESSNAGEVEVLYDPTKIEILDSDSTQPGVQIVEGDAYQSYIYNTVDTTNGVIRLAGASFTNSLSNKRTFGEIEFRGLAGAGTAGFSIRFDGVGNTFDSNIADTSTSNDLLTGVTNGNYTFIVGPCQADTISPNVFFNAPQNGAQNFPLDGNVSVRITDNQSGVNLSTLEFIIDGFTYTVSDPQVTYTGSDLDYNFVINPDDNFIDGAAGTVRVRGADNAGNTFNRIITFNQPVPPPPVLDTDPPAVIYIDPENLASNVDSNQEIFINITDEESAIDQGSVVIYINGEAYILSDPEVQVTENSPLNLDIIITPRRPLLSSTYNIIRTEGRDVSGNRFNQSMFFNIPDGEYTQSQCQEVYNLIEANQETTVCEEPIAPFTPTDNNFLDNTILEDSFLDTLLKTLGPSGLFGLLAALALLSNFAYLITLPGLFLKLLGYLLGNDNRRPIGVITDSVSSKPIPFAICSLYLKDSEYLVERALADQEGRYEFAVNPGEYRLVVQKQAYATREKIVYVPSENIDYTGFDIKLSPIELANFSYSNSFDRFKNQASILIKNLTNYLFISGFIFSLFATWILPNTWNLMILGFYLLVLLFRLLSLLRAIKPSSVENSETGLKIPYVIVKVYDTKSWNIVTTEITNALGRFDINRLEPGNYALQAISAGFSFPSKESKNLVKRGLIQLTTVEVGKVSEITLKMDPTTHTKDSSEDHTKIHSPFSE